jgi:hypothetical protein
MNYNNLPEAYVCIHIKIMNYRRKIKVNYGEKIKTLTTEED